MILRRRRRQASPRMRLLELTVAVRYASSRLGLLANRVRMTYLRTRDEGLLELLRRILLLQSVLDILAVRLETLASVGAVSGDVLAVVRSVLSQIRGSLGGIQPMIDTLLLDLENMVSTIAASSGIELPDVRAEPRLSREAEEILERARAVAEARLAETMPGAPS